MNISINEQKTKSEPQYFITIFAVSCDNISCDNIESISSQSAFPSVTRLQFKFPPKLRYWSKTFATFCTKQIGVMMRAIKNTEKMMTVIILIKCVLNVDFALVEGLM